MASFTDQIQKFDPYIQQLPVEEMKQVGMYKQQQYDQGVQKIQGYIDNIAGMDVANDVDKQHLQSKLNELGNNLKTVAAGDFSNHQLVNSVGGMATSIVKDPLVQNAVSSTAWLRKQSAEMEKAIQSGKSSESNIYDFNEKASKYLSATKVGEVFRDRYTPYRDVKAKAMEAIKALHPNLQKYDIPFEIRDGQVVLDQKGRAVIADAMQRKEIKGIDEGQIKQAISAALTPDDINQLSIDAKYQFRGITPEALVQRVTGSYESNKRSYLESIKLLNDQKKTTTDPTQLSEIDKYLKYYNSRIGENGKPGTLETELAENLKNIRENPDAVKTSIYTDGFVKEFSNAFNWKEASIELVKNPIRDQMNWVEQQKLAIQKENRERYEFSVTSGQAQQKIDISREQLVLDAEKNALQKAKIFGVNSAWTTLGNPTDNVNKANEMYIEHSESVTNNINAGRKELNNAGYTNEQVNMMLNKEMDIPAKAMGTIQNMLKQQNYLKSLKDKSDKLKVEATSEIENSPEYKEKLKLANQFAKSINGGRPITLVGEWDVKTKSSPTKRITAEDMINNILSGKASINIDKAPLGSMRYSDGDITVNIKKQGADVEGAGEMRKVFNQISEFSNRGFFNLKTDAKKQIDEKYKEKLSPIVSTLVPQIKALGSDKDGSPTAATLGQVSALITATIARGVKADALYNAAVSSDMIKDKNAKDTRIFIQQSGDNYEVILKSESDPTQLQRIKATANEIISNFGSQYVNQNVQESIRLNIGKGNTNITGRPQDSFMQKAFGDFSGIRKMNVTADLDQDISNRDLYVPSINVMRKDGNWQQFYLSGQNNLSRVGFDQGKINLNALTDDTLLKSLKLTYPNYDYSQLDIK